jgi:DNA-directed RNA polymerase subunit RPC12/RpoP
MAYLIEEIKNLPHYREYICRSCGHKQKAYILSIEGRCENCNKNITLRGFASTGTETEDIIDTVLEWIGNGKVFELAMERKTEIDRYIEEEKKKQP